MQQNRIDHHGYCTGRRGAGGTLRSNSANQHMYVHFSCIGVHIIYSISGIYTNTKKPNDRRLQRLNAYLLQSYGEDTRSMYTQKPLHSKRKYSYSIIFLHPRHFFFSKLIFFFIFLSFLLILNLSIQRFLISYHFTIGGSGENVGVSCHTLSQGW